MNYESSCSSQSQGFSPLFFVIWPSYEIEFFFDKNIATIEFIINEAFMKNS